MHISIVLKCYTTKHNNIKRFCSNTSTRTVTKTKFKTLIYALNRLCFFLEAQ